MEVHNAGQADRTIIAKIKSMGHGICGLDVDGSRHKFVRLYVKLSRFCPSGHDFLSRSRSSSDSCLFGFLKTKKSRAGGIWTEY